MPPNSVFRFGGVTFDSASGDLKTAGETTRLQPQVAALLGVLIEHAGSVVSRADLQARLWPDTTVEFDEGINFCVRQLRLALGDAAATPRFIETLPKRGYRLLTPVTTESAGDEATPRILPPAAATVTRSRPNATILLVGGALAVAVALTALARGHWLARQTEKHDAVVVAILPLAADTTDSMMVTYRRRLTDQILADARSEHGWQTATATSPATTHVLSGSLTRQGNSVRIFVELVLAGTRQHLWADDIVDMYAFSGNAANTADRIEKSAARALGIRH